MTLFIKTPRIQYEISDLYIMALALCISFIVGRTVKSVVEKQYKKSKKSKNIQMPNPRGGAIGLQVSNDTELESLILSSIVENEAYLVKDKKIRQVIFSLVKAKIKDESLVLTPNMMRFLALKLLKSDSGLITKIGNTVVLSDNRVPFLNRGVGSAVIRIANALLSSFSYGILIMLLYFENIANCGYRCNDYLERLPKDQPVKVFAEEPTGRLVIAGNDDVHQVEIYIPSKTSSDVAISSTGETKVTKTHKKSRKKAKEVRFSDFIKKDGVLSSFDGVEETSVPQNVCPMDDTNELINLKID